MNEVLKLYMEELESIRPMSDSELREAIPALLSGDKAVRNRIIEGNIKYVMGLLFDFTDKGVDMNDLICEANLALASATDDYDGRTDYKEYITEAVKDSLSELIRETAFQKEEDEDLAERVNELSDISVELVQELGREPTQAELAQKLNVSEDVIDRLIRMSMDAL